MSISALRGTSSPVRSHVENFFPPGPFLAEEELARIEFVNKTDELKDFKALKIDAVFDSDSGEQGLINALSEIKTVASEAIKTGVNILIISDRKVDKDKAPIAFLLAVGAIHITT